MATVTIFDIANESTEAAAGDYFVMDSLTETKKIHRDNAFKQAGLKRFTEIAHDYGNVSGTHQHDIDAYGNNAKMTLTAAATLLTPSVTLGGEQSVEGFIEILGADLYGITWDGNWDFGELGPPTASAKLLIGFYKRAGDTLTKVVGYTGGYS